MPVVGIWNTIACCCPAERPWFGNSTLTAGESLLVVNCGTTPPLAAASWMQDFVTSAVGYARHLTGDGLGEVRIVGVVAAPTAAATTGNAPRGLRLFESERHIRRRGARAFLDDAAQQGSVGDVAHVEELRERAEAEALAAQKASYARMAANKAQAARAIFAASGDLGNFSGYSQGSPDYERLIKTRDAVWKHPEARAVFSNGRREQTFVARDPETGELIKCRTDYLHDSGAMIVDVKTTDDASPSGFGKSAANYRYPIQTAWYNHVLDSAFGEHPANWVFLAVEKSPPYAIGIYVTEADQVARASIAARENFHRIVECKRSGQWPDYGITPQGP